MVICFQLGWIKEGTPMHRAFKFPENFGLFSNYLGRISKFSPTQASSIPKSVKKLPRTQTWVCTLDPDAKKITSEQLAEKLDQTQSLGLSELRILIGGPDGFSKEALEQIKPDFKWCFGPLTLPHELAAVLASEQIYRAWTILRRLPYHANH